MSRLEPPEILGTTNIDLYPLCSTQAENRHLKLVFNQASDENQAAAGPPEISCNVKISSDHAILSKPNGNSLYITVESICNLENAVDDNLKINIGFMAPVGQEV